MRFNPNSGHWEKTDEDYAEERRRWDEGTARLARASRGARVKVGPAYDMETRARTRSDEFTGTEGTILRFEGDDAIIETARDEVAINVERLKLADAPRGRATGIAECVCWDYETPDAPCTCGAAS